MKRDVASTAFIPRLGVRVGIKEVLQGLCVARPHAMGVKERLAQ